MPKFFDATVLARLTGHREPLYSLAAPTPGQLLTCAGDGLIARWQVPQTLTTAPQAQALLQAQGPIYCIAAQGSTLFAGQNDGTLLVADATRSALLHQLKAHTGSIFSILPLPEGHSLGPAVLTAGADGLLKLWSLPAMQLQQTLKLSTTSIRSLALSPGGEQLALGASDGHITILQTDNLTQALACWPAHEPTVFSLSYSTNGRYLLSAGRDGHLRLWDRVEHFAELTALPAHLNTVHHIALSPDGRLLASASMDKTIKLWRFTPAQAPHLQLLKVIDPQREGGHRSSVNRLAWLPASPDYPYRLASASDDRTAIVWGLQPLPTASL